MDLRLAEMQVRAAERPVSKFQEDEKRGDCQLAQIIHGVVFEPGGRSPGLATRMAHILGEFCLALSESAELSVHTALRK
jgi:hypothetical protein